MKQCTKCKIEKELDKFQTYWHSTQNKSRTRAECTECLYKIRNEKKRLKRKEAKLIQVSIKEELIQPVVPELQPEVLHRQCSDCKEIKELNESNFRKNCGERRYYSNRCDECQKHIDKIYAQTKRDEEKLQKHLEHSTNANQRQCRTCKEWKDDDKYYHHKSKARTPYLDCKSCCNKAELVKVHARKDKETLENGGSFRHYQEPNKWFDDLQRESTFNILKAIGWTFNEEKGIWWKEGIKTSEGIFINIKPKPKPKKVRKQIDYRGFRHAAFANSEEIYKLRMDGMSLKKIAYQYNTSAPTISKIITIYEQTIK